MNVAIAYESLTGNTRRAAELMGRYLGRAGVESAVFPVTRLDYQALARADVVVVGTWTDGIFVVGQRPGRAQRLRRLPVLGGKQALVFCTFALDPGRTLDKMTRILEGRGASVLGGMALRRNDLDGGAKDFVDRLLEAIPAQ
jgi:hypothetical protein